MEGTQTFVPHASSPILPCDFNDALDFQHTSSALPTALIPRPSSCPPILPKWDVPATQRAFPTTSEPPTMMDHAGGTPLTETSAVPFRGPTRSDSDVRTADTQTCVSTIHTSVTAGHGVRAP